MRHALDALVGHWNTTGDSAPDGDGAAISIRGMDKYEWLPGRKFLVHHADVWMGDDKVNVIEVIGPYGDTLEAIPMNSFDHEGNHTVMHARQESANVWLFSNDELRTRLTIDESGRSMTARWERKAHGERWTHWLNMHFSRTT
jgi:hypothetical protein